MADNKNTNVETIEVEATVEETEATEVNEVKVLDENGKEVVEVEPVSLFAKIGTKIDAGLTHGKRFFKKNGKKIATGAAVVGGGIALTAAGMALSDLDKKLGEGESASEPPFDYDAIDYERAERAGIDAANAEIEKQLAAAEAPVEEAGAEA